MPDEKNALKAGLFIVVAVALIAVVWVLIKGLGTFTEDQQENTVAFTLKDDIGGLKSGGEVRVGGYKVGVVTDIKLHRAADKPDEEPMVYVEIKVPQKVDVRKDAVVLVQSTVTGQAWVNFTKLGSGAKLKPGELIDGTTGGISALISEISDLTPQIKKTLADASQTIAELKKVGATVNAKLGPLADTAEGALAQARDAIQENRPDVKEALASAKDVLNTGREKLPKLIDDADNLFKQAKQAVAKADKALDVAQEALADAKDVTGTARSLVVENKGRIQHVIDGLKETSDNLQAASASIRHSPWRLLYKPSNAEQGNLDLFDTARQFADGAGSLNDTATALRDAMNDPAADKAKIRRLLDKLDNQFGQFKQVESALFEKVKE